MTNHHQFAAKAGRPTKKDAPAIDRGAQAEQQDSAKTTTTAIARAALLGIEARSIGPGSWLLRHAHGACIGAVYGHEALAAAVAGFEAARNDVLALVQRMAGGGL